MLIFGAETAAFVQRKEPQWSSEVSCTDVVYLCPLNHSMNGICSDSMNVTWLFTPRPHCRKIRFVSDLGDAFTKVACVAFLKKDLCCSDCHVVFLG